MIEKRFIGKEYPPRTYEVGREKIREYVTTVGDLNPLYLNEEVAKKSKFQEIIAPPIFIVLCWIQCAMVMFHDKEVIPDLTGGVHGDVEIQFFEVIRRRDVITVKARISDIYTKKGRDFIVYEMVMNNQKGDKVATVKTTHIFPS